MGEQDRTRGLPLSLSASLQEEVLPIKEHPASTSVTDPPRVEPLFLPSHLSRIRGELAPPIHPHWASQP